MAFVPQNINDFRNRMAGLSIIPSAINGAVDTLGAAFNNRKQLEAQRYKEYLDALYKLRELQSRGHGGEKDKANELKYTSFEDFDKQMRKDAQDKTNKNAQDYISAVPQQQRQMWAKNHLAGTLDAFRARIGDGNGRISNAANILADVNQGLLSLDANQVKDMFSSNPEVMMALQKSLPTMNKYLPQFGSVGQEIAQRAPGLLEQGYQNAVSDATQRHLQGFQSEIQNNVKGDRWAKLKNGIRSIAGFMDPNSAVDANPLKTYALYNTAEARQKFPGQADDLLNVGKNWLTKYGSQQSLAAMNPIDRLGFQELMNRFDPNKAVKDVYYQSFGADPAAPFSSGKMSQDQ